MGCGSSRPKNDLAELVHNKRQQSQEPEQKYTRVRIEQGLQVVADHLHANGLDARIVAVGGAVSTVLLRTRAATGDVDFFCRTKDANAGRTNREMREVIEGGKIAERKLGLGRQWLNNHTVVFIEEETMNELYAEAVQQDDKVFRARGLTVYAAPWHYALISKLDRLGKPGAKEYDMSDAVDYLERLICHARGGRAVKVSEVKAWAKKYKLVTPTDAVIDTLARTYRVKCGKDGIVYT